MEMLTNVKMQPITHECAVGGVLHSDIVYPEDIELSSKCSVCGHRMAPPIESIVATMYAHLTSLDS